MINLEFLGLDASGEKLTFNDADGNRYEAQISAELRGALRKDFAVPNGEKATQETALRPASPKEIQAYFRAGKSIAEVSEICTLPPLQLTKLASPILAERKFIANQARRFHKNHDSAEMSVEELVTSRLISRGVDLATIEWDAVREPGLPWILIARYVVAGNTTDARWQVNSKAHFITPLNDEATWLTDTPIPTPNDPWRPLNTPKVSEINQAHANSSALQTDAEIAGGKPAADLVDSSLSTPASAAVNVWSVGKAGNSEDGSAGTQTIDIDAMLASLDEQRGVSQPTPQFAAETEFAGAHPAYSEPENATDAQILQFPEKKGANASAPRSQITPSDAEAADGVQALPGLAAADGGKVNQADRSKDSEAGGKQKNKSRRGRPEMPSWDEIIYGYPKDHE